jgi:restriction endonuclease Mrr
LQAKRYKDGSNIGAAAIREFLCSLVGNKAKGVFVATSRLTTDAREYARSVQHHMS